MQRNVFRAWALLLSLFLVCTVPRLWNDVHREEIPAPSPTSSIDWMLEGLLHIPQPSETLVQTFAQLPADCRIIFVSPANDDHRKFVGSAVCYLMWPRKIGRVELGPNETFAGTATEHSAVVFCGIPPPIGKGTYHVICSDLILLGPITSK
jgi:hypothetical protein